MAYFIFLKSLRSLGEFRKNPHVKIPPKSPCANFQSLSIFKNQILFEKDFSRHFRPIRPFGPATSHFLFFSIGHFPPPHWASASRPAQLNSRPNGRLLPPHRAGRAPPPGLRCRRTRGAKTPPPSVQDPPPPPSTIKQ
jgi:hypothetical protein